MKKGMNNKGFSLVELIIVVAIMAVLVGVLAPQYIKYLDKSKLSADKQVADALYQALTTTYMDPDFATKTDFPGAGTYNICGGTTKYATGTDGYWAEIADIMGPNTATLLEAEFKLDVKKIEATLSTDKTWAVTVEYNTPDDQYDFVIE